MKHNHTVRKNNNMHGIKNATYQIKIHVKVFKAIQEWLATEMGTPGAAFDAVNGKEANWYIECGEDMQYRILYVGTTEEIEFIRSLLSFGELKANY